MLTAEIWPTLSVIPLPLQWCLHSQHAPVQWLRGLWWRWTPHRSKRKPYILLSSSGQSPTPKTSNSLKTFADSSVERAEPQSVPESQKVGKHPYKPNRPGKSWHLKIENLWEKTAKGGIKRAKEGKPRAKEKSKIKRVKITKQKHLVTVL